MSDFHDRLTRATIRIQYGNDERSAGADDRARAIADEVARRGRGGQKAVAEELGVSEQAISQAVSRARSAASPMRALPTDTLERLLAAERTDVPPLPAAHWENLAAVLRGTFIDVTWIEQPGLLLAQEVEDLEPGEIPHAAELAAACRSWTRTQALAVIDVCLREDLAALPTRQG